MRNLLLAAAVLALSGAVASAQTSDAQPQGQTTPQQHGQWQGGQGHRGGERMNPEFETRMLTKRLSLTPDQATQVKQILTEQHEQMKAMHPAASTAQPGTETSQPDWKAMQAQRHTLMEQTHQKLTAILTPDQQQKFSDMMKHHGHGGPHGQYSAPPAS